MSYTDIEKGDIDWSAYRVPFNYATKVIRANPQLTPEDFEKEHDSPYKIKKYHYNFRREEELTEENLQRTYVNLCTNAFFHNKEKTMRQENLNLDTLDSDERERVMYSMKRELEEMSELATQNESLFSPANLNPTHSQYSLWKRNLMMPLSDQLEEHAKRKLAEQQEAALVEEEKDQVFRQQDDNVGLHDIDSQM